MNPQLLTLGFRLRLWFWLWLWFWIWLWLGFGQRRQVIQPRSTNNGRIIFIRIIHVAVSTESRYLPADRVIPSEDPLASDYTILPDTIWARIFHRITVIRHPNIISGKSLHIQIPL